MLEWYANFWTMIPPPHPNPLSGITLFLSVMGTIGMGCVILWGIKQYFVGAWDTNDIMPLVIFGTIFALPGIAIVPLVLIPTVYTFIGIGKLRVWNVTRLRENANRLAVQQANEHAEQLRLERDYQDVISMVEGKLLPSYCDEEGNIGYHHCESRCNIKTTLHPPAGTDGVPREKLWLKML
jgi:hypothetical protein